MFILTYLKSPAETAEYEGVILEKRWTGASGSNKEFELLVSILLGEEVKIGRVFVNAITYAASQAGDRIFLKEPTIKRDPIIITEEVMRRYGRR